MVAQGLTNREIAARLFISERTVDGHLEHLREKLGVNTRSQVTAWVVRHEAAEVAAPAGAPARVVAPPSWTFVHPRAWVAAELVLAVLAAGVGVLRLTSPVPPIIRTVVGSQCAAVTPSWFSLNFPPTSENQPPCNSVVASGASGCSLRSRVMFGFNSPSRFQRG